MSDTAANLTALQVINLLTGPDNTYADSRRHHTPEALVRRLARFPSPFCEPSPFSDLCLVVLLLINIVNGQQAGARSKTCRVEALRGLLNEQEGLFTIFEHMGSVRYLLRGALSNAEAEGLVNALDLDD